MSASGELVISRDTASSTASAPKFRLGFNPLIGGADRATRRTDT